MELFVLIRIIIVLSLKVPSAFLFYRNMAATEEGEQYEFKPTQKVTWDRSKLMATHYAAVQMRDRKPQQITPNRSMPILG